MFDVALIDQCKNPNVPTEIIKKIISVESANNPYSINVNKIGSFKFKTSSEAKDKIMQYINDYNIDIGLMQFNTNNLKLSYFNHYSIDDLLEPCTNIKAGSDLFYLAYESTDKNLNYEERVNQALSIYNTGNIKTGFTNGYVNKFNQNIISEYEIAKRSNTKLILEYKLFNLDTIKQVNNEKNN